MKLPVVSTKVKAAGRVALLCGGALLIGFIAWKVFFAGAIARKQIAETTVQAEASKAQTQATEAALDQVIMRTESYTIIKDQTDDNIRIIKGTAGAAEKLSPSLDRAGRNALCVYNSYASVNDCSGLSQTDPSDPTPASP